MREGVNYEVEADEIYLRVIKTRVDKWPKEVDDIKEKIEKIVKGLAEAENQCLKGWCRNIYPLVAKKAGKISKALADHKAQRKKFKGLASPPLLAGMFAQLKKFKVLARPPLLAGMVPLFARDSRSPSSNAQVPISYPKRYSTDFESRSLIMIEIMDALKDDQVCMVGLCGIGGVGKTTMVKQVERVMKAEQLFDVFVMVTVGRQPDPIKIQTVIGEHLGLKLPEQESLNARANRVREILRQINKFLIILDDVWNTLNLTEVGIPTGNDHKGSKVILTSRSEDVCLKMGTKKIIKIQQLKEYEAWVLFRDMTGCSVDSSDLWDIAVEIVELCHGLPLALVTMGRVLRGKGKYEWDNALEKLTAPCQGTLTRVHAGVYPSLLLSYNYIASEEAKFLFKLCCLFPEGFEIPIEELFRIVKVKQLFEGRDQLNVARDHVFHLVNDLKMCYFLLEGENENYVKVQDVLRDFGISISSDQRGKDVFLICDDNLKQWPGEETFENYTCISITMNAMAWLPGGLNCSSLELLMLCHNDCPLFLPANFFERMGELKILILRKMTIVMHEPSLGLLKNLRYLCIQDCGRIEIISTIGDLLNLEILSFRGSHLYEIPKAIGKLKNLKLLDLTNCEFLEKISPCVISSLIKLEELYMGSFGYWEVEGVKTRQNTSLSELEHLSYLNTLEIWIPNLATLPKSPFFSKLAKYCITVGKENICHKASSTMFEKKLLLLHLNKIESLSGGIDELSKNTEFLYLNGLESEDTLCEVIQNGFHNLKELKIHRCKTPKFLEMGNCPLPTRARSLAHLTSIEVTNCLGLENLFSLSMADGLVQLRYLEVSDSEILEQIFSEEIEQEVNTQKMIKFPNLEELKLQSLPKLTSFCKSKGIEFPKLKALTLVNLPNIRSLFSDADAATNALFPKTFNIPCLHRLCVEGMTNLREMSGSQLQADLYVELRDLFVRNCPKLVNIITSNAITRLYNLERLCVWNCPSVEEIVAADQGGGENTEEARKTMIWLPALRQLDLGYLPKLKCFYRKRPSYTSLKLGDSSAIGFRHYYLFSKQVVLQSLRTLNLNHVGSVQTIFHYPDSAGSLQTLEHIQISSCSNLMSVMAVHVQWDKIKIPQLQELTLGRLPNLRSFSLQIFDPMPCEECSNTQDWKAMEVVGTLFDGKVSFPKLSRLIVEKLDNVHNIWSNQLQKGSFHKISEMSVTHCNELRKLAPSFVAESLLRLKQLLIGDCSKMEEAFGKEEIAEQGRVRFTKLCRLGLVNMPNLRRFCDITHEWILPSLRVVAMSNCPNIYTFSPGLVKTPSLQHLLIIPDIKTSSPEAFWNEFGWKRKMVWLNNINDTLWYICKQEGKGKAWKGETSKEMEPWRGSGRLESEYLEEGVEKLTTPDVEQNKELKENERKLEKGKEKCLDRFEKQPSVEKELSKAESKIKDLKADLKGQASKEEIGKEKRLGPSDVESLELEEDVEELTTAEIEESKEFKAMERRSEKGKEKCLEVEEELSGTEAKVKVSKADSKGHAWKEEIGKKKCLGPSDMEPLELEEDVEELTTAEIEDNKEFKAMERRSEKGKEKCLEEEEDLPGTEAKVKVLKADSKGQASKEEIGKEKRLGPSDVESLELEEDVEELTTAKIEESKEVKAMERRSEKGKEKCLEMEEELSGTEAKVKVLKADSKGRAWKEEIGREKCLGRSDVESLELEEDMEELTTAEIKEDKEFKAMERRLEKGEEKCLEVEEELTGTEAKVKVLKADSEVSLTSRSGLDKAIMQTEEEMLLQPPQAIYDLAINSAVQQVVEYFKQRRFGKIGICGSKSREVLKTLKDLPEINDSFCIRSISLSKYLRTITKLKITVLRILAADHRLLLLMDTIDKQVDLHKLDFDGVAIVIAMEANKVNDMLAVDLEIRMEDHLQPWKLFCNNVGCVLHDSSALQHKAAMLIEECHPHSLAIGLLAAALKGLTDESEWELAHSELIWHPSSELNGMSVIMINVLRYIWKRMDKKCKNCIKYCVSLGEMKELHDALLIRDWIEAGYADTEGEAKLILEKLNHSFLLEKVSGGFVRMIEEVRIVLLNVFVPGKDPAYLIQGNLGLTKIPEDMEWNVKEIHLMNNKLSILPACPYCPFLVRLLLQGNRNLRVIPAEFFESMPMLKLLDLSYTSIKTLPDSISKLFSLQEFFLQGCDLLMQLPACLRELTNLKVFDLEGTELMYPPLVIGEIVNLTRLIMCLYGYANCHLEAKKKEKPPRMNLSKLSQLTELRIKVHPEGEWWDEEVKELLNDVYSLKHLAILEVHLPHVGLLESSICKKLRKFRFIVGRDQPPYKSCVPQESEEEFKKWDKSLKLINGEDEPAKIAEVLQYANAFFLDRHWTIKKISEFGIENMKELKFCLLIECNELETIIDGEDKQDESQIALESLQYLSLRCMKKLESICRGPVGCTDCLFQLKFLALHRCPSLTTIFTLPILHNLENLEELIIQDCPRIKNLVSPKPSELTTGYFLPSLKKMSFLELPKLDSISGGLCIAPKLEILVIFCCPMLKFLSRTDILSKDLKAIKGEKEWWYALRWRESDMSKDDQDYLNNRFTKIERGECLMSHLTNG